MRQLLAVWSFVLLFFFLSANVDAGKSYTITASAGSGGSISPSGAVSVTSGGSKTFTITPSTGYHISNVTVDGVSRGAIASFIFSNVTADHTISATFGINSYTIIATGGTGGSITPLSATVNYGGSQAFTIAPVTGYHVADVIVDTVSQGAITSYTFSNVAATHTISATFAINTYTITATGGTGGSVTPSSASVNYGGSQTFTIAPATGYHLTDVTVDGVSQGAASSYTFSNVTANHSISATFAINTYTITATAGTGGTITPSSTTLNYGGTQAFTVAPSTGYQISNILVDGVSQWAISSYTFTSVSADHSIAATFATNAVPSKSTSQYFYDDAGRLTRVTQGTTGVIYAYDSLGNLLSTSSATTSGGSPTLTVINPAVLFTGSTTPVTITGEHLLTADSLTANGGLISIKSLTATDTSITAEMTAVSPGAETITATMRSGATATINATVSSSKLSFTPSQLALAPGANGTLTASVYPPIGVPVTINLISDAPSVATVPQTITIPATGSVTIAVTSSQSGVARITSGDPRAVIFVGSPFSGDVNGLASGAVSVRVDAPPGTSPAVAGGVSVKIQ